MGTNEQMRQLSQSWECPTLGEVPVNSHEIHAAPPQSVACERIDRLTRASDLFRFSTCRFHQLPEPAGSPYFFQSGWAPGYSLVQLGSVRPQLPSSTRVSEHRVGQFRFADLGPRWTRIAIQSLSLSTTYPYWRIRLDLSFQHTAPYFISATLVLIYLVERCWGHQAKFFPRVAHKIEGSSLSCFGSKLAPAA